MSVPPEVADLVSDRALMAFLATSNDDRPHAAPVWYRYDDGTFEVLTGGRKLANVRENPRVCVSVQEDDDGDARWYASFFGTAAVVEDADEIRAAMERVYPLYIESDPAAWDAQYREQYENPGPDFALLRIDVGSATYSVYE